MACAFPRVITIALDPESWTELKVPANCNYYLVKSAEGVPLTFRGDENDATTEDTYISESMFAPHVPAVFGSSRYRAGDSLGFFRGAGSLKAKFWA